MKQIIIAGLLIILATSAFAFLDPTPDTVGIYLDTDAEEMCVPGLVDGDTDFTFYMIITNPSFSSMQGFFLGYHFNGIASLNSATLAEAGATDDGFLGDHIVHFASPVPVGDSVLLMTISATYESFEYDSAQLMLHGILLADKDAGGPAVFDEAGDPIELLLTFDDGATIRINDNCDIVANENLTIDSIKSMYR